MDDARVCLDSCGWRHCGFGDFIRRRTDLVDLRFARGGYRAVGGTCSACRRGPFLSGCAGELFLRPDADLAGRPPGRARQFRPVWPGNFGGLDETPVAPARRAASWWRADVTSS